MRCCNMVLKKLKKSWKLPCRMSPVTPASPLTPQLMPQPYEELGFFFERITQTRNLVGTKVRYCCYCYCCCSSCTCVRQLLLLFTLCVHIIPYWCCWFLFIFNIMPVRTVQVCGYDMIVYFSYQMYEMVYYTGALCLLPRAFTRWVLGHEYGILVLLYTWFWCSRGPGNAVPWRAKMPI